MLVNKAINNSCDSHRSWMSTIPSTRKTWKILDIQVFTFSDLEINGMAVVYSINPKGTDIPLICIYSLRPMKSAILSLKKNLTKSAILEIGSQLPA